MPNTEIDAATVPDVVDITEHGQDSREDDSPESQEPSAEAAPESAPVGLAEASDQEIRQALEAILIISDQPTTHVELATALSLPADRVEKLLIELAAEYVNQGRGFELRCIDLGWRFYSAAACSELIAAYVKEGRTARLTQAALETLAVVAYRQPISRARIGAIRGVNVDGVMRTLVTRGLVCEMETDPSTGAVLYGTTQFFLERMGLDSIADLPSIVDHLPDLSVLDDFIEPGH